MDPKTFKKAILSGRKYRPVTKEEADKLVEEYLAKYPCMKKHAESIRRTLASKQVPE